MKPSQAAINALEKIISKIESWQSRYGHYDENRGIGAAKHDLIAELRRLENLKQGDE